MEIYAFNASSFNAVSARRRRRRKMDKQQTRLISLSHILNLESNGREALKLNDDDIKFNDLSVFYVCLALNLLNLVN